ncbi:MAG: Uma2 family endonuclease [Actinobacteria bacterium]|nr:Uma2 family endonuclease [Actinomycetota bacterium]
MPVPLDSPDEAPEYDYPHLPGEELDPIMESTTHSAWCTLLVQSAQHTMAGTGALVTGNTPFVPAGEKYHTAPDLMVLPGMAGREFGRYLVDEHGVVPSVCVEVVSPSNSWPRLERRYRRWLQAGVGEVYALHPDRETVHRIELIDGEIVRTDALGKYSEGMRMAFVRSDGHLALCCPGGRTVGLRADPFGWLLQEQSRADEAESRLADSEARAAFLEAELRLLRGEAD